MTTTNLMAVPAMHGDAHISGVIAFWRLSGAVNFDALQLEWVKRNLDPSLLPAPVTHSTALRRTMSVFREQHVLVRSIKGDKEGFMLVHEYFDGGVPRYVNGMRVTLGADGYLTIEESECDADEISIRKMFAHNLTTLTQQDVSGWLVDLVRGVQAVRLRDTGGIYFIPRSTLVTWRLYVAAIRSASSSVIFEIPSLQSDEAVSAVLDALMREVEEATEEMTVQLDAIGAGITDRQRGTRMERIGKVERKVETYEALFGVKLVELREQFETLQSRIVATALAVKV